VDLREIAREQRRRQAQDALEFERQREAALRGALEVTAAELEGAGIDEAAFAQMAPEEVKIVRGVVSESGDLDLSADLGEEWISFESEDDVRAGQAEEVVRLQGELADARRRQAAFERYLELL
jgi:hypothetical protein